MSRRRALTLELVLDWRGEGCPRFCLEDENLLGQRFRCGGIPDRKTGRPGGLRALFGRSRLLCGRVPRHLCCEPAFVEVRHAPARGYGDGIGLCSGKGEALPFVAGGLCCAGTVTAVVKGPSADRPLPKGGPHDFGSGNFRKVVTGFRAFPISVQPSFSVTGRDKVLRDFPIFWLNGARQGSPQAP